MFNQIKQLLAPLRYWRELPLRECGDRPALSQKPNQRIPSIVYQTWEDNLFGKSHLEEIHRFRDLNPEFDFVLLNRIQREDYLKQQWGNHPIYSIYQKSLFGPMKADIFRYCLLADRGGFYFDISKGCSVPLRQLYQKTTEALITFEPHENPSLVNSPALQHLQHPTKLVLQWGFGFAPQNPILEKMIENICRHYPLYQGKVFASPKNAIRELTGPLMFTKTVHEVLAQGPLPHLEQCGIDFNNFGIFALKGSKVRYMTAPAYTKAKNCPIVL
jgi:mannosyltransferase OCH1-like enzyme